MDAYEEFDLMVEWDVSEEMEPTDKWDYYYSLNLETFHRRYGAVYGYLSFIICIFGIAANIANIVVFTRRSMISPTHAILTALAAAEMLMMLSYMIFAFHAHIRRGWQKPVPSSYGQAVFNLVKLNFRVVAWNVSAWMTVAVAVFRVIAVRCPAGAATWCSMARAKCAIATTCLVAAACCIPIYITFTITPTHEEGGYRLGFSHIVQWNEYLLLRIIPWYQVVLWLMPCFALIVFSSLLIGYILLQRNAVDNTTRMLLAVFLLTLLAQFPLVLVRLLACILGYHHLEYPLISLLEAVVLISKAFKFAIYYLMIRQFRNTFVALFLSIFLSARRSESNSESVATMANTVI